jgi:hypothetical protein
MGNMMMMMTLKVFQDLFAKSVQHTAFLFFYFFIFIFYGFPAVHHAHLSWVDTQQYRFCDVVGSLPALLTVFCSYSVYVAGVIWHAGGQLIGTCISMIC